VPGEGDAAVSVAGPAVVSPPASRTPDAPRLVPTAALTSALLLATLGLVMAAVMLVVHPKVSGLLSTPTRQGAETALFVVAFLVLLPLALVAGPRLAGAIAAGPNGGALAAVAALLAGALAALVVAVRIADAVLPGGGMGPLLAAMVLWWAGAAAVVARALRPPRRPALERLAAAQPRLAGVAAVAAFGALLTVTHLRHVSPVPIVLGGIAVGIGLALLTARRRAVRLAGPRGLLADLVIAVPLLLVVPNLQFLLPGVPPLSFTDGFKNYVMQFHSSFLLGPANQVLGGADMLVQTTSQYGVGSIDFVAGWFHLVPIGYGMLALLDGLLTMLLFAAGYLVMRLAGAPRPLAGAALAVAIGALVLNLAYPIGGIPQESALRFGMPMAAILAVVTGARRPAWATAAQAAALLVLAVASIWAFEAFTYTAATLLAMWCLEAVLRGGGRRRWLARRAVLAVAACVGAHVAFAVATRLSSGDWPDWGLYLGIVHAFLGGDIGDVTYDFYAWTPGLAVGAAYLVSMVGLVLLVRLEPVVARRERTALLAIAGATVYGICLFTYFVNRSAPNVLPYLCYPLVLAGVLWLALIRRADPGRPREPTVGAFAFAMVVAVLLITSAWPSMGHRLGQTSLAYAIPGGKSLHTGLARLKHLRVVHVAEAQAGTRLLDRYVPGERRTLVLAQPPYDLEILLQSGRANALPIPNAPGDSYVPEVSTPLVRDAVAALRPGRRMLVDAGQLQAAAFAIKNPKYVEVFHTAPGTKAELIQIRALLAIERRFRLRTIHTEGNLSVVELVSRGG
jgi:hypothetical protein